MSCSIEACGFAHAPLNSRATQVHAARGTIKALVLDDEVSDGKGAAIEGRFRASFLEPAGILVGKCDDDELVCKSVERPGYEKPRSIQNELSPVQPGGLH
jgi:hypothetical protein